MSCAKAAVGITLLIADLSWKVILIILIIFYINSSSFLKKLDKYLIVFIK